jgi:hypothetical protein
MLVQMAGARDALASCALPALISAARVFAD